MSLMDFQHALKPEAREECEAFFNVVKKADGSEVDLRKTSWMSEEFKVFFDENDSGVEQIKSKFEIKKGQKKIKGALKDIFFVLRSDYWPQESEPIPSDAEFLTIDEALSHFYGQKDLIEALIQNDALFDERYFWKQKDGQWHKSWWMDDSIEIMEQPQAIAAPSGTQYLPRE